VIIIVRTAPVSHLCSYNKDPLAEASLTWSLSIVVVELGNQPCGDSHFDQKYDSMEEWLWSEKSVVSRL
jgi:hypothetical protein